MSKSADPKASTSRRAVLAGISVAVAPVAAAVEKSIAIADPAVDPIFGLIEAHDRAASRELALFREKDKLEEALPDEQKTWTIDFSGDGRWPPEGCTDASEWINVQLAVGEASDRRTDLMLALLTTAPTTIEGAITLLERLGAAFFPEERDLDGAETLISTMGNWYDARVMDAADVFHSALAVALRKIIVG